MSFGGTGKRPENHHRSVGTLDSAKVRYLFSLAALATGTALLIYFLTGLSLWAGIFVTITVSVTAIGLAWRLLNLVQRRVVLVQARAGLLAGLLATVCYDASRYIFVRAADFSLWPFDSFKLFGQLLVGTKLPEQVVLLIGTCYHIANGIGFALAYTFLFGMRGWKAGVAWAMGLELLMVSFYPGWLGLQALDEFLSVSVLGHVVYGATLGWCSRRLLLKYTTRVSGHGASTST